MPSYLIAFDLKKAGSDYAGLMEAVRKYPSFVQLSRTTFAVETGDSPEQLFEARGVLRRRDDQEVVRRCSDEQTAPRQSAQLKAAAQYWCAALTDRVQRRHSRDHL